MEKILIVDNEKNIRELLTITLRRAGYTTETAEDGASALDCLSRDTYDVLITDIKMPGMSGLELLRAAATTSPETLTVMMTAFASIETAIEAMKEGAYDYLTKPFQIDAVKRVIQNALERKKLRAENRQLRHALKGGAEFEKIIGNSEALRKVLDVVRKVSSGKSNVLITGESGTGKELIARAIHFNSGRRDNPFVTINCSAIPETLFESELFGHMRGAFTGAVGNKQGLFELADTGSLFLDEIGEIPLSVQAKLLRTLQEREFRRVGGTKEIKVDVRLIAATNKNLEKSVAEGSFREDLYYRLDVIPIHLPALRERREDIPLLTLSFLRQFNAEMGKKIEGIHPDALRVLMHEEWKGNIRELANVMERTVALASGPVLTLKEVGESLGRPLSTLPTIVAPAIPKEGLDLENLIENLEKELLLKALEESGGVKTEAAKRLHLDFRSMRYRLNKYDIKSHEEGTHPHDPSDTSG